MRTLQRMLVDTRPLRDDHAQEHTNLAYYALSPGGSSEIQA